MSMFKTFMPTSLGLVLSFTENISTSHSSECTQTHLCSYEEMRFKCQLKRQDTINTTT